MALAQDIQFLQWVGQQQGLDPLVIQQQIRDAVAKAPLAERQQFASFVGSPVPNAANAPQLDPFSIAQYSAQGDAAGLSKAQALADLAFQAGGLRTDFRNARRDMRRDFRLDKRDMRRGFMRGKQDLATNRLQAMSGLRESLMSRGLAGGVAQQQRNRLNTSFNRAGNRMTQDFRTSMRDLRGDRRLAMRDWRINKGRALGGIKLAKQGVRQDYWGTMRGLSTMKEGQLAGLQSQVGA